MTLRGAMSSPQEKAPWCVIKLQMSLLAFFQRVQKLRQTITGIFLHLSPSPTVVVFSEESHVLNHLTTLLLKIKGKVESTCTGSETSRLVTRPDMISSSTVKASKAWKGRPSHTCGIGPTNRIIRKMPHHLSASTAHLQRLTARPLSLKSHGLK